MCIRDRSWADAEWFLNRPQLAEKITVTVFKVTGETNTDDLSPCLLYTSLGSEIDVVEMFDQVIPAADKDVVKVFTKRISKKFNLMLEDVYKRQP